MTGVNFDQMVSDWILSKYMESERYDARVYGTLADLMVITADVAWECNCYSEYTRDDVQVLTARIRTAKCDIEFRYGTWGDLPGILGEIMEQQDLAEVCQAEADEQRDSDSW